MKTSPLALALAAALSCFGHTALAQDVSHDPASIRAGLYKVEPAHSQVEFRVSHLGFTIFSGLFSGASGTLRLDPARPGATALDVTVPVRSVISTVPQLVEELKGPRWFDVAQFPTARFVSTSVKREGEADALIRGDLTLHGVTRPVELKAHFVGAGLDVFNKSYTVGFEATGVIKRSEFGMKTDLPLIGDDVKLMIAGAFVPGP